MQLKADEVEARWRDDRKRSCAFSVVEALARAGIWPRDWFVTSARSFRNLGCLGQTKCDPGSISRHQ